jgi:hypothetical protein
MLDGRVANTEDVIAVGIGQSHPLDPPLDPDVIVGRTSEGVSP